MLRNLFTKPEDRVEEYRKLRQRLYELDEKAVDYSNKLALQKSIIDGLDSMPFEKKGAAIKQFSNFLKSQNKEVINAVNERNRIIKAIGDYLKDNAIKRDCAKIDTLYNVKKLYKNGKIKKSLYFNIIKGVTGEPVKYADVLAQDKNTGKFLILHRVENFVPTGKVCIPGGHVDEGEDFFDAAIRELKEETNLDPIKDSQVIDLGEYNDGDAWIHYFLIQVDGNQPVTVDSSEHCFSEWVDITDFAVLPFIFDQGVLAMKKFAEQKMIYENVEKILSAYRDGKLTQEVFLTVAGRMFKKAMDCDKTAPLMPESMDGDTKVIFAVRDSNKDIERIIKGIDGLSEVKIGGVNHKFVKPLFIKNVSYVQDPSDNYLSQMEIIYDGDEYDMCNILENIAASLRFGGKLVVETENEEFIAANERGCDYVGDPIFCIVSNSN